MSLGRNVTAKHVSGLWWWFHILYIRQNTNCISPQLKLKFYIPQPMQRIYGAQSKCTISKTEKSLTNVALNCGKQLVDMVTHCIALFQDLKFIAYQLTVERKLCGNFIVLTTTTNLFFRYMYVFFYIISLRGIIFVNLCLAIFTE